MAYCKEKGKGSSWVNWVSGTEWTPLLFWQKSGSNNPVPPTWKCHFHAVRPVVKLMLGMPTASQDRCEKEGRRALSFIVKSQHMLHPYSSSSLLLALWFHVPDGKSIWKKAPLPCLINC